MIFVNQSVMQSASQLQSDQSFDIKSVIQVNKSSIQPIRSFTSLFVACQLVRSASLVSLSISQSVSHSAMKVSEWVSQSVRSLSDAIRSVSQSVLL